MNRLSFAVFSSVVLLAVSVGCHLGDNLGEQTIFQQMDRNRDGKISRQEFSAGFGAAMFTVYNRPRTGTISAVEWNGIERYNTGREHSSFPLLDVNHDGKLSLAEISSGKDRDAAVERIFNRIDKNHDGFISVEEGKPSGLDRTPVERAQQTGL